MLMRSGLESRSGRGARLEGVGFGSCRVLVEKLGDSDSDEWAELSVETATAIHHAFESVKNLEHHVLARRMLEFQQHCKKSGQLFTYLLVAGKYNVHTWDLCCARRLMQTARGLGHMQRLDDVDDRTKTIGFIGTVAVKGVHRAVGAVCVIDLGSIVGIGYTRIGCWIWWW